MPAKPLSPEQQRDADRLRAAFKLWQSAQREAGRPWTQDDVADLFGIGQSALSQYIKGRIPLNAPALARFASVLGINPANISPSIVAEQQALAAGLQGVPAPAAADPIEQPAAASRKVAA